MLKRAVLDLTATDWGELGGARRRRGRPGRGKGAGISAGIEAAAGLAAVLLTRGPEAELPRGSTMDVVFERDLTLDGSQVQFSNLRQFQAVYQPPVRPHQPR